MREPARTPARLVLFPMLSGRLWSCDHQAVPTAAMNHCITEPPLDRRGEREEEARREEGRDEEGGGSGVVGQGKMETRWRKTQEANEEEEREGEKTEVKKRGQVVEESQKMEGDKDEIGQPTAF